MNETPATDYDQADPRWSCYRKKTYGSLQIAKAVARNIAKRGGQVRPYACRHCGMFHVGKDPDA